MRPQWSRRSTVTTAIVAPPLRPTGSSRYSGEDKWFFYFAHLLNVGLRPPTVHSKVLQSTGDFHHEIVIQVLSMAEQICDHAASLHPTNEMFHHHANPGDQAMFLFLFRCQRLPCGVFLRWKRLDRCWGLPLETCILIERYVFGIRRGFCIGSLFLRAFPLRGLAQIIDLARMETAQNERLDGVRFFFPLEYCCCLSASQGRCRGRSVPSLP